jgi:uncharacterized protein
MPGLLIELIISWLLLWVFCKQDLLVLGIVPTKDRSFNLALGFLIAATCCTLFYLCFSVFVNYKWTINNKITGQDLLNSSWWTLKSVLYEEFIFRGAILYLLIKKFGTRAACITSAICFGIYHWFTSGVMGNPIQMIYVFLMTAVWGAMFALAFASTRSLYLPIGLHFGWNFISTVIFSQGPIGDKLLIGSGNQKLGWALSVIVFLFQLIAVPVLVYCYLKWKLARKAVHLQETAILINKGASNSLHH